MRPPGPRRGRGERARRDGARRLCRPDPGLDNLFVVFVSFLSSRVPRGLSGRPRPPPELAGEAHGLRAAREGGTRGGRRRRGAGCKGGTRRGGERRRRGRRRGCRPYCPGPCCRSCQCCSSSSPEPSVPGPDRPHARARPFPPDRGQEGDRPRARGRPGLAERAADRGVVGLRRRGQPCGLPVVDQLQLLFQGRSFGGSCALAAAVPSDRRAPRRSRRGV